MKVRDNPSFPTAPHDGTYGCCRCGTYHRLKAGAKLACSYCRSAAPLIIVAVVDDQPKSDTPNPPVSNRGTDTYSDSSESSH